MNDDVSPALELAHLEQLGLLAERLSLPNYDEWTLDEVITAWDHLDNIIRMLEIIRRDAGNRIGSQVRDYEHPGIGDIHTDRGSRTTWDTGATLRRLTEPLIDPATGEVVNALLPHVVERVARINYFLKGELNHLGIEYGGLVETVYSNAFTVKRGRRYRSRTTPKGEREPSASPEGADVGPVAE